MFDNGNGTYAYADDLDEARKLFVDDLTSTLQVIALDDKIQVDFNPNVVAYFYLIAPIKPDLVRKPRRANQYAGKTPKWLNLPAWSAGPAKFGRWGISLSARDQIPTP